ncbi:MAG: type II secretion system GspH family protein [Candidatus Omnitrophica bacterium]|nr:type II secretion system GspH family protein [Candidatus Omnitrophota bacterium]
MNTFKVWQDKQTRNNIIDMVLRRELTRGFTLLEVILTMGILLFAICGILSSYVLCATLVTTSKNVNIATNAALGLAEEIRSSSFTRIIDDYNGLVFTVNDIPQSRGVVYVDDDNPELLKVVISVCWLQGNRVVGEDLNLNGWLDAGEDSNGNGIIDSTVQLTTLIANR